MKELNEILGKASAAIAAGYYKLAIYGGPPVYRERVYCYELYHQMRVEWGKVDTPFILNGEVDKRAHHVLEELGVTGQKPDLLVHLPGNWEGNFAIIEVKHIEGFLKESRKIWKRWRSFTKPLAIPGQSF